MIEMDIDLKLIYDSIKSGILIGIGCIAYVALPNHILGSFLFSLGLLTICINKWTLFTGRIGSIGTYNKYCDSVSLANMLLLNMIGIALICFPFACFSGIDLSFVNTMMDNKEAETWYECLVRSIGCGVMMQVAVSGYSKTKNPLTVIMPIMVFILCGFEHCIANFGYMVMSDRYLFMPFVLMVLGNGIGSCLISKLES